MATARMVHVILAGYGYIVLQVLTQIALILGWAVASRGWLLMRYLSGDGGGERMSARPDAAGCILGWRILL
jgi:hypothetical protein